MSRRQFLLMLVGIPLLLPIFFSTSFLVIKSTDLGATLLDIQPEYSNALSDVMIEKMATATFKVERNDYKREPSPRSWMFVARGTKEVPLKMAFEREIAPVEIPQKETVSLMSTQIKSPQGGVNTHLNVNLETRDYIGYADISGIVLFPISVPNLRVEVSFFDRINTNGIDDESSTVLVSQGFQAFQQTFSLQLPIESHGFLIAKAYEEGNEDPIFIGVPSINPITVSKEGLQDIAIQMVSKEAFFEEHQTFFRGKAMNEYAPEACLTHLRVWVVETDAYAETGEDCTFSFRGLHVGEIYQFILQREDFITQAFEVVMDERQKQQSFILSPESKFVRGYDIFLGERDPQKSVLFATIRHNGKPLYQGVVKSSRGGMVVYIRTQDEFSVPDRRLYSTDQNGEFVFWNALRGKQTLQFFQDGKLLGSKSVKLSPGVVHRLTLDL